MMIVELLECYRERNNWFAKYDNVRHKTIQFEEEKKICIKNRFG